MKQEPTGLGSTGLWPTGLWQGGADVRWDGSSDRPGDGTITCLRGRASKERSRQARDDANQRVGDLIDLQLRRFVREAESNGAFENSIWGLHGLQHVRGLARAARACRSGAACDARMVERHLEGLTIDAWKGHAQGMRQPRSRFAEDHRSGVVLAQSRLEAGSQSLHVVRALIEFRDREGRGEGKAAGEGRHFGSRPDSELLKAAEEPGGNGHSML